MPKRRKWASAEQKRKYMELQESWESVKSKYKPQVVLPKKSSLSMTYKVPAGRSTNRHIPSLQETAGVGAAKQSKVYTGDKMLGIGTLHKSNAVPIFSDAEAKDQANMRR